MFISKSLQPFVKSDFEGESPLFDLFIWPLQSLTPATPHLVCMLDFSVICMQQARISFSPSWVGQAGRCVMVARRHRDLNNFVYVQSTTVHRTRVTSNDLQSSQDGHPLFFWGKKTNVKSHKSHFSLYSSASIMIWTNPTEAQQIPTPTSCSEFSDPFIWVCALIPRSFRIMSAITSLQPVVIF